MSELDAVIKGLNMGLSWKMNILHICTDSKAVFHWVTDALTGKTRLRTKASNEMLIRRRLQIITNIVDEYKLRVDIKLVASEFNLAKIACSNKTLFALSNLTINLLTQVFKHL